MVFTLGISIPDSMDLGADQDIVAPFEERGAWIGSSSWPGICPWATWKRGLGICCSSRLLYGVDVVDAVVDEIDLAASVEFLENRFRMSGGRIGGDLL